MLFPLIHKKIKCLIKVVVALCIFNALCFADNDLPIDKVPPPVLTQAVLCERIIDSSKPVNKGVVFSSGLGRLFCFTHFESIYEKTIIYHKYYYKDKFIKERKLSLKPPRWATSSDIELRESDKGPWRVEITDAEDNLLSSIRFSITD